jgi:putative phosphoribosyl transferase
MKQSDVFSNRWEAGHALAARVAQHLRQQQITGRPLVLALPRGGVPIGQVVAEEIDGDLDIAVVRKIGMPGQPEFGVGAVTADGRVLFDEATLRWVGISPAQLADDVERERAEAVRRLDLYRGRRPPAAVAGRVAIVVDDGLATGVTARAALHAVRDQRPAQLIFAAPTCAADAAQRVEAEADAVICLVRSEEFTAVGRWYRDFAQVSDDEVKKILHDAWSTATSR